MTYAALRITPLNRPIRRFHTPAAGSEEARREQQRFAEWQANRRALMTEFEQTYLAVDHPNDDDGFIAGAHKDAAFKVWQLVRQGHVAAATLPFWASSIDFWLLHGSYETDDDDGILIDKEEPGAASVTLPFVMAGGEFSVRFETEQYCLGDRPVSISLQSDKRLVVKSEHGIHVGELISDCGEMTWEIVKLPANTPQEVADRVAAAWYRINQINLPADYPVVMPLREACTMCHRPFTDPVSKTIGLGPNCAKQLGVPHSAAVADQLIARRRALLESG